MIYERRLYQCRFQSLNEKKIGTQKIINVSKIEQIIWADELLWKISFYFSKIIQNKE